MPYISNFRRLDSDYSHDHTDKIMIFIIPEMLDKKLKVSAMKKLG